MKIGVFVLPPTILKNKILIEKNQIKKKFGNQTYLSHPPHLTIFVFETEKKYEKNIKKIKTFKNKSNIKFKLTKFSLFKNDISTNKTTVIYRVKKNPNHNSFQKKIIEIFTRYVHSVPRENMFKKKTMNDSYLKYGYPFVGINWKPHFTLASVDKTVVESTYFMSLLEKKIEFQFVAKQIGIYKISGDKHTLINRINII